MDVSKDQKYIDESTLYPRTKTRIYFRKTHRKQKLTSRAFVSQILREFLSELFEARRNKQEIATNLSDSAS